MTQSTENKIIRRIRARGRGSAISSKDFLALGSRAAVDQALSRLARRGVIRRLLPGIYDWPRTNPALGGTLAPVPLAVAQAIARKNNLRLLAPGAVAANALGLSTQVPARNVFLTDGPSRTVRLGRQQLAFRHAAPRTMALGGQAPRLLLLALQYLGQEALTPELQARLRGRLAGLPKAQLRKLARSAPGWLRATLFPPQDAC